MSEEIDSNERWFDAVRIQKAEVQRHGGIDYIRCPFCESLNRMTDDYKGLHICGDCHVPFLV